MTDAAYQPDRRKSAPVPPMAYPWWVLPALAAMILAIFGGALAASCFMANETLQTQMFTQAAMLSALAVGFFFGSSKSSQDKDAATAATTIKQADTIAAQGAALASSAPVAPVIVTTKTEPDATTTTTTAPAGSTPPKEIHA